MGKGKRTEDDSVLCLIPIAPRPRPHPQSLYRCCPLLVFIIFSLLIYNIY
nr:hypothetical protein Iba_chr05fCG11070 [Ipomoea batatas]